MVSSVTHDVQNKDTNMVSSVTHDVQNKDTMYPTLSEPPSVAHRSNYAKNIIFNVQCKFMVSLSEIGYVDM